jgi:hypothetical protein
MTLKYAILTGIGLGLLLVGLLGCPKPPPDVGEPHASGPMRCGTVAIEACAPSALPLIYSCLDGTGDATSCLMGLIRPVGCAAYEVIACLVRGEGYKAEQLAQAESKNTAVGVMGPTEPTNWRRAQRAKEFLEKTHAEFVEP